MTKYRLQRTKKGKITVSVSSMENGRVKVRATIYQSGEGEGLDGVYEMTDGLKTLVQRVRSRQATAGVLEGGQ